MTLLIRHIRSIGDDGICMHVCKMNTSDTVPFPHPSPSLPFLCCITVIELSAEIATLQAAALNTRQELKHSMKAKHNLQEKASAAQLDTVSD